MKDLHRLLTELEEQARLPKVFAYNRIDGPGSSLDLREFQSAFWTVPEGAMPEDAGDFAIWSRNLPRTVGITIDIGCAIEAHPLESGKVGISSHDYGYHQERPARRIPFVKDLWLLKTLEIFGLSGVRFHLSNLVPGIKSSGLGGSATATTGVCLLANELAKAGFDGEQIVAIASLLEQDMGISITGTQEQSNVVFGGVTDYIWFPWGIPGRQGSYGSSLRRALLHETDYGDLADRIRIYHTGKERASTDVNSVWRQKLATPSGYEAHLSKLDIAFDFAEGLRTKDWDRVGSSLRRYVKVRVDLCADYMTSECWDIQGQCEAHGAESFPLGAGGGGALLIFSPSPKRLTELDSVLSQVYRRIDFKLRSEGHLFANLPD